jgi:hypothetical protein
MEVTVNIPFDDLLGLVNRLTPTQRERLKAELANPPARASSKDRLRKLLLTGPALTNLQLKSVKQARKEINQWRTK